MSATGGSPEPYDLIVVGLGAMGSAVAYHAARSGQRVLGVDRYDPPHDLGSTKAETRITRLAVGEGSHYLPFVARSHQLWRDLEVRSGEQLLHQCGGYIVTPRGESTDDRWGDFVSATNTIAAQAGIDFSIIEPAQFRTQHPGIVVGDDERVGYEPTAGLVMAERAVAVQIDLARRDGAEIHTGERVVSITPSVASVGGSVTQSAASAVVETDAGRYHGHRVVVATGPWIPELASTLDQPALRVTRQLAVWFEVDELEAFRTETLPFFIWAGASIDDYVGVFPMPPGGTPALKFVSEQFHESTDPDRAERSVSRSEIDDFYERLVHPKIPSVSNRCVKAAVCLYTNTPDDHFLIDTSPESDQVLYMSPCSGHGFKHSTALGEAVAQWAATGSLSPDLEPFQRARLH